MYNGASGLMRAIELLNWLDENRPIVEVQEFGPAASTKTSHLPAVEPRSIGRVSKSSAAGSLGNICAAAFAPGRNTPEKLKLK
jgi:hypothetical protein